MLSIKKIIPSVVLLATTSFVQAQYWTKNGNDINYNDGNVGIGTAVPQVSLEIKKSVAGGLGPVLRLTGGGFDGAQCAIDLATYDPGTLLPGARIIATDAGVYGSILDFQSKQPGAIANALVTRLRIDQDGRVGVGTTTPSSLFHVHQVNPPANTVGSESEFARFTGHTATNISQFRMLLRRHTLSEGGWTNMSGRIQFTTDQSNQGYVEFNPAGGEWGMAFGTGNTEIMRMSLDGRVAIGTTAFPAADAKLAVKGTIYSQEVKVTLTGWADYVFDKGYRLRPLSEVEQYIQQNHHLPEVPSAEQVKKEGLQLGDNQVTLLKKVEELTLYLIEQDKCLKKQNEKQQELAEQIKSLIEQNMKLQDQLREFVSGKK